MVELHEQRMDSKKVNKKNDLNRTIYDKRTDKNGTILVKVFEERPSVLTIALQDENLKPVYSICVTLLIVMFIKNILQSYIYENEFSFGFRLIKTGFSGLSLGFMLWGCMFASVFPVFYIFKFWSLSAVRMKPKSFFVKIWKYLGLLCLLTYYIALMYYSTKSLVRMKLGVACNFAITMEVCRILMVIHSFVRSNVPKVLQHEENKEKHLFPKISNFLYFFFAPTLIYKDSYPRSKENINWNLIAVYVAEFLSCILFLSYIYGSSFIPYVKDFGLKPYTAGDILMISLQCFPFGLLTVFVVFYTGLHIWLNVFADIMGFSDKLFYKDWWTCTSFGEYYRNWNVTVHDWLYTYIYKDFYENVIPSKVLGRFLVFFISGVFHEYVFSFACGFFLPICIVQIFITVIIMELSKLLQTKLANSFFLFALGFGISLNSTVYLMEYYARVNCPIPDSELSPYDFFIPRFLSCYN